METALEHILIIACKDEMIVYLKNHPEDFEEAIKLAISNKHPFGWRSAWLLWSCIEENDKRIRKYTKQIIDAISTKGDGHQRELLKLLQLIELDEEEEGTLLDFCINLWKKVDKRPSVRYTAFMFINKMAYKYPDLLHEINMLSEDHYLDTLSPGIKQAVSRMIINMNK